MKNLIAFFILFFCVFTVNAQKKEQVKDPTAAGSVKKNPSTILKVSNAIKVIVIDSVSIPQKI